MKRILTRLAPVVAVAAVVPMLGAISTPANADDGAGCIKGWGLASATPGNSAKFNASINCNGVWVRQSLSYVVQVKGQYKDGTWTNSSLSAKWAYPGIVDKQQIVGQTVDGRLVRGIRVAGTGNLVQFKF